MEKVFFKDWELWQQMTFVLACAIVIVFIIGFIKLWWTNRYMARIEIIDAEKRAHASEMESTGLPPPRKQSDIPFGVRAIQSGIEVDGIWISRPGTPASDSPPSSSKGKGKYVAQGPIEPSSPTDSDPFNSPTSSTSRGNYGPQTYRPKSMSSTNRVVNSQADALRRLEGEPTAAVNYQHYQPQPRGIMHDDQYGPTDRISTDYGVDVRVPIRPPPVNRHLNNARTGGSSNAPKTTGHGVRSFSGSLQIPKQGYSNVPQGSPGDHFSDPFATPSRSPVTTPGADHALLHSQHQQHHVTFAPDEYIHEEDHHHAHYGSSGSPSGSSRSSQ